MAWSDQHPYIMRFVKTFAFTLVFMVVAWTIGSFIWTPMPWAWLIVPVAPAEIGLLDCYEMRKARIERERFEQKRREMEARHEL